MIANLKWAFHAASHYFSLFSLCSYSTITLSNMPHCQAPPPHVYQIITPPSSKEKVIEIIRQKFNCNLDLVIRCFTDFASLFPNEPFPPGLKLILLSCNENENTTSLLPIPPPSHLKFFEVTYARLLGPSFVPTPLLLLLYGTFPPRLATYINRQWISLWVRSLFWAPHF